MGIFLCWQVFPAQADVAQLVERSIRNRQVSGSTPLVGSILRGQNRAPRRPLSIRLQSGNLPGRVFGSQFFLDNSNRKLVACYPVTKGY